MRNNFVLVSFHFDLCTEAVKQKIIPNLKSMEKAMFKRGLHKKWDTQTQPEFTLISKNTQEPFSSDNSQKVQLKQKLKYMKNSLHVEYLVPSIVHMLTVWKQLEEGGMLHPLLGRDIAVLKVGYITPRTDSVVQQFLQAVCSNSACNMFYTVIYLRDILHIKHFGDRKIE